jgi:hypothetical protein
MNKQEYQAKYISTMTTTSVASGRMTLHTVVCPLALTGSLVFEDTASSPNTYFVIPAGSQGTFLFDCVLNNGLQVISSYADKVIINWQN